MQNGGVILVNTSMMLTGSNVTSTVKWNGGQGVLALAATQFAPIIKLVLVEVGSQNAIITMSTGAIAGNMVLPIMLPAGGYQLHSATGSSVGIYAALLPTP